MPCPMLAAPQSRMGSFLRSLLNRVIATMAWLLSDWLGWRAALAVYPPLLRNRVAIVTGANAGLGLETTKALLQQGATVIMVCRSLEHGHTAREDVLADPCNHGPLGSAAERLRVMQADYEDFASVRKFADDFHQLGLPLHLLVNNAGVHLKEYKHVDCGFERTIATNYFSHFYLTQLLLEDLKRSAPSRVINVASVSELLGPIMYTRTIPWDDLRGRGLTDSGERPYVMAKTYLLMANTRELARRMEGTGVDVIAVHPGIADTTWYLKSDDKYAFSWVISRVRSVAPFLGCGQPASCGAISSIYASMVPELTGISSSPSAHGIIDTISRTLFGGRLIYFGPAYLFNILGGPINFFNTTRCWVLNPWAYNRAACARLYDSSLDLIGQVEQELGLPASQRRSVAAVADGSGSGSSSADGVAAGGAIAGGAVAADGVNGSDSGSNSTGLPAGDATGGSSVDFRSAVTGLKQRQQQAAVPAAPLGVEEVQ